jgi:hypothetical protein
LTARTTTFRGDDPPALVDAGLACDTCLSGAVDWTLDGDPIEPAAITSCPQCGAVAVVYLTWEQALRLELSQRPLS